MPPKRNGVKEEEFHDSWGKMGMAQWEEEHPNPLGNRWGDNVNGGSRQSGSQAGSWAPPPISQRYANSPEPSATKATATPVVRGLRVHQLRGNNGDGPSGPFSFKPPHGSQAPGLRRTGMNIPGPSTAAQQVASDARNRPPPPASKPRPPDEPTSRTMAFATALPSKTLDAAIPMRGNPHDATIAESRGAALVDVTRAFFGKHRRASERILWTLPPEHDERVISLLDWIEQMQWALANFGVQKFLSSQKRGALISNAGYESRSHPDEPVFDWFTFDRAQLTDDRNLQESITSYDPATTVVVFVFLVSPTYDSVAIWRRKLTVPPSIQLRQSVAVEALKTRLAKTTNVIHIKSPALWTGPPPKRSYTPSTPSTPRSALPKPALPAPVPVAEKVVEVQVEVKKKKPKWWQFWKRIKWGKS